MRLCGLESGKGIYVPCGRSRWCDTVRGDGGLESEGRTSKSLYARMSIRGRAM